MRSADDLVAARNSFTYNLERPVRQSKEIRMKHQPQSALLILAIFALSACAGKPDVPDEQAPREYASTKSDKSETADITAIEPQPSAGAPRATGPVATVDGAAVTAEDFNTEIARGVAKGMQPGLLQQFKDQIVDQLIDRTLIDNAIAGANIKVTDTEVDAKMEEVRAEFAKASAALGQDGSLETAAEQMGITADELRQSIEQAIAIEKILATRGFNAPDPAKVKSFYDDNKERFERPEQVRVRHILFKVDNPEDQAAWDTAQKRAQMMRAEAAKPGADFAALARENSEGPMADQGGDLGFRARGVMPEEFDAIAFTMKKGEISQPVKTNFGYHIIKLEDRHDAGIVPYDEISDQLMAQMTNEAVNEALIGLLDELRKNAKIERHPENVN